MSRWCRFCKCSCSCKKEVTWTQWCPFEHGLVNWMIGFLESFIAVFALYWWVDLDPQMNQANPQTQQRPVFIFHLIFQWKHNVNHKRFQIKLFGKIANSQSPRINKDKQQNTAQINIYFLIHVIYICKSVAPLVFFHCELFISFCKSASCFWQMWNLPSNDNTLLDLRQRHLLETFSMYLFWDWIFRHFVPLKVHQKCSRRKNMSELVILEDGGRRSQDHLQRHVGHFH